jgi:hypothetical protein
MLIPEQMLKFTLLQTTPAIVIAVILFLLLILFYLLGYRLRLRKIRKSNENTVEDLGAINGTLLGLLALLLAFTFGMSNSRFDTRRALVIEEANAIGTAILRADILPDSIRTVLRSHLEEYVDARIEFYKVKMDVEKMVESYYRAEEISAKIWTIAADYARKDPVTAKASEMIPALNDMIDITTTRRAAGEATIPDSIMYFLLFLCLASSFLLGYDRKNKFDWVIVIGFAVMLSATVFTIIDLDRPRSGLIDMDKPNERIYDLKEMF